MKPIRIFRHIRCEGPGYLLDLLQQRAIPYQLITIDADGKVVDYWRGLESSEALVKKIQGLMAK